MKETETASVSTSDRSNTPHPPHRFSSLWADKNYVLNLIRDRAKYHGYGLLENAHKDLHADPDIILEAVRQSHYGIQYADENLLIDRDFLLEAVWLNGLVHNRIMNNFYFDPAIMATAYLSPNAAHLPEKMKQSIPPTVWKERFDHALARDWRIIAHLSDFDMSLSPAEELAVFNQGLKDTEHPLELHHLHLFPSLRKKGTFMDLSLGKAHENLRHNSLPYPSHSRTQVPIMHPGRPLNIT
jgi:hypothetical protein